LSNGDDVRFSNRPFWVKHFQTIHHHSVDVAHGLVLLFGIGTKAVCTENLNPDIVVMKAAKDRA
jgi:hypothetical protein